MCRLRPGYHRLKPVSGKALNALSGVYRHPGTGNELQLVHTTGECLHYAGVCADDCRDIHHCHRNHFIGYFQSAFCRRSAARGGLVVIYSTIGGMWSLTLTDIIQFIIMTVGLIFILLPISVYSAGGWDTLTGSLPETHLSFSNIGYDTILTYFLIYFLGIFIGQDIWQRVFTARSEKVAVRAGVVSGLYCILYGLACAVIGMAAKVMLPDLSVPDNAFAAIVTDVLPTGVRGLVVAASLAALMSTASAGLLASSTTAAQDLWPLLRGNAAIENTNINVNRVCTLGLGVLVLIIAPAIGDVISALTMAYNLLVGGMLIPLIGAIYWRGATTRGAIVSMAVGALVACVFMFKDGLLANTPIYYSLTAALLSFILFSVTDSNKRIARPHTGVNEHKG